MDERNSAGSAQAGQGTGPPERVGSTLADDAVRHASPGGPGSMSMVREVRAGLSRPQKELPPKFFYDRRGSELFERITELPEYYLTRVERGLLQRLAPRWVRVLQPRSLVELGAGSAEKTRLILDAMTATSPAAVYVPVDVSEEFLEATALRLRSEYPGLQVRPAVADISADFALADGLPHPTLYAFLGSTIGNFVPSAAVRLLRSVRAMMQPKDRLLLGVDLRKEVGTIEAAYNDAAGLTAEFNRNILHVLNRELGADFEPEAYEHRAFYDPRVHWIEMHLVATTTQRVTIPGAGEWEIRRGESIRTEISCKHDRASVDGLFSQAGLRVESWDTNTEERFALVLGAADG
jgi:L-histidine Nalpha-methyltransferase